jgi:hypothetical protein
VKEATVMRVAEIWQHPVKSMIGQQVQRAEVTTDGLRGDRGWAVRDEVRGGIRGAKKIAALMKLEARYVDGESGDVAITLPDGASVLSSDPDANARVSAALGHEVTLWPLQPADQLEHYRRGAPDSDDVMVELRQIFGREESEPLPDFSIFPPVIMEYESPPGTYLDAFPLMMMTTAALDALRRALPDATIDVRRFRPNLVIDSGDENGHPEFGWVGRRLRVGGAVIEVGEKCPRCVMVTREIDGTIPEDRSVLRHIVRDLDQNVGVYASVLTPGTIAVGDEVTVV